MKPYMLQKCLWASSIRSLYDTATDQRVATLGRHKTYKRTFVGHLDNQPAMYSSAGERLDEFALRVYFRANPQAQPAPPPEESHSLGLFA